MVAHQQVLTLTLIVASTAFAAGARNPKIAPDLAQANSAVDVIVQFNTPPSKAHHEKIRRAGGHLVQTMDGFRGAKYRLHPASLEQLAADPSVVYISPDRAVSASADYVTAEANADIAQSYGFNGAGIGIAVIDSGVNDKHPDLQGRIVYQEAFDGTSWTFDKYGHGTHVAGIAVGTGPGFTMTFRGIAPAANLINLRVLDSNGQGSDSLVIAAIHRAIQLKSQYNIRVINLSLGRQRWAHVQQRHFWLRHDRRARQ